MQFWAALFLQSHDTLEPSCSQIAMEGFSVRNTQIKGFSVMPISNNFSPAIFLWLTTHTYFQNTLELISTESKHATNLAK